MDWTTWRGATCLPECWCEATRTGSWILEPVNTWTNLFFVIAGMIFLLKAKDLTTHTNKLSSKPLYPQIYGYSLIFMGIGSFFFHASQTFAGQWFDVFGMYLVSMFYISYNYYRLGKLNEKSFLGVYLLSCTFLGVVIYFYPETRRWLFGVSIVFTLFQSIWAQRILKTKINHQYLIGAAISYALAQTLWILDKNKIWCNPYSWINGHGLWHIFTGIAAILIYGHFHSEKENIKIK